MDEITKKNIIYYLIKLDKGRNLSEFEIQELINQKLAGNNGGCQTIYEKGKVMLDAIHSVPIPRTIYTCEKE